MKKAACLVFSGGKDSSFALHLMRTSEPWKSQFQVVCMLTTLNGNTGRVSMHGVREAMLDEQAKSIGLPLRKVYVTETSNEHYEQKMSEALNGIKI